MTPRSSPLPASLSALIEKWRKRLPGSGLGAEYNNGREAAYLMCADELQAALSASSAAPETEVSIEDVAGCVDFGASTKEILDEIRGPSSAAAPAKDETPSATLEEADYTLIAEAVDDFLGFDITTREQQDRITRWAHTARWAVHAGRSSAARAEDEGTKP